MTEKRQDNYSLDTIGFDCLTINNVKLNSTQNKIINSIKHNYNIDTVIHENILRIQYLFKLNNGKLIYNLKNDSLYFNEISFGDDTLAVNYCHSILNKNTNIEPLKGLFGRSISKKNIECFNDSIISNVKILYKNDTNNYFMFKFLNDKLINIEYIN